MHAPRAKEVPSDIFCIQIMIRTRVKPIFQRWMQDPVMNEGSINNGATNSSSVGATMTTKVGTLDANVYATKKTIAQGLLDVALLTANASQLKYLLQAGSEHEFYYVMMALIILSIILQVLTGSLMLLVANTNLNDPKKQGYANHMNNAVTIGVFLVAILNILISALGIKNSDDVQNYVLSQLH